MERRFGFCFTIMKTGVAPAARLPAARSFSTSSWRSSIRGPVPRRSFLICFFFFRPSSTTTGRGPSAWLIESLPGSHEHPGPAAALLDDHDHGLGAAGDRLVLAELGEEVLGVLEQRPLALAQLLDGLAAAPPEVGHDRGRSGGRGLGVAHHEPPIQRSRIVAQCPQAAFGCTFAPVLDPALVPTPLDDRRETRLVEVTPPPP